MEESKRGATLRVKRYIYGITCDRFATNTQTEQQKEEAEKKRKRARKTEQLVTHAKLQNAK